MDVTTMDNPLLALVMGIGLAVTIIAGAVHFVQNMRDKQGRASARRDLAG
jgi:hypothetical protein